MRLLLLSALVGCKPDGVPSAPACPGTAEVCDGIDNDCDGRVDEDGGAWFRDADGDGHGDPHVSGTMCEPTAGWVELGDDCDDLDPDTHPGAPERCDGADDDCDGEVDEHAVDAAWLFEDRDGDGYGDASALTCPAPGWVAAHGDCDDADPDRSPGAVEVCNGIDDDCDGAVDVDAVDAVPVFVDLDEDLFGVDPGALGCPEAGLALVGGDCDDADPDIHPGRVERCNGVDDDCDGVTDVDAIDRVQAFFDGDGDGQGAGEVQVACPGPGWVHTATDCDDADPTVFVGAVEGVADGVDQDCDGLELCYVDLDFDGHGVGPPTPAFDVTCGQFGLSVLDDDCDDADPLVSPSAPEICGNGTDDDCSPATDDVSDFDGDGLTCDLDCAEFGPIDHPTMTYTPSASLVGLDTWTGTLHGNTCGPEIFAFGAAVEDLDGDGDLDLFLPRMNLPDQLFVNNGDGTFRDASSEWGIGDPGNASGAVFFDADGDRDLDLLVVRIGVDGNLLYINDGTTFIEEGVARGVTVQQADLVCTNAFSASVADFDGDGDLDFWTGQWESRAQALLNPDVLDKDRLWINDGDGFFTQSQAIQLDDLSPFTAAWGDLDGDGDLDVAISADWGHSTVWRNDGDLVFTDVTESANVSDAVNGMGNAMADVNGDGHLDWFVAAITEHPGGAPMCNGLALIECTGSHLFLGNGDLTFTNGTAAAGVNDAAWAWGAIFFDLDNDGDLDLGSENGYHTQGFGQEATRLFENDGTGVFTDIACATGLGAKGLGRGFVPFDADGDGDDDVILGHTDAPLLYFESRGAEANGWLTVRLDQPGANPWGVGATVWLQTVDGEVRRDVHRNSQYGATVPARAHFGLGASHGPVDLRVVWPDGTEQLELDVEVDQVVTISRAP